MRCYTPWGQRAQAACMAPWAWPAATRPCARRVHPLPSSCTSLRQRWPPARGPSLRRSDTARALRAASSKQGGTKGRMPLPLSRRPCLCPSWQAMYWGGAHLQVGVRHHVVAVVGQPDVGLHGECAQAAPPQALQHAQHGGRARQLAARRVVQVHLRGRPLRSALHGRTFSLPGASCVSICALAGPQAM